VSRPGCWRVGPLARGTYLVEAGAEGFARSSSRAEVGDGEPVTVRIRLARSRRAEILVRAAATGGAIAGARVRVEERPTQPLAYALTDADGRASLALPDDPGRGLRLCVAHPLYAPSVRVLEAAPSITVELTAGARLVVRLADPELARESCTLQLWPTGSEAYLETHLPLLRAVPHDGVLELDRLAPGDWEWSLFGSIGASDVLALLTPEHMPRVLARGELVLTEGQTFELAIAGAPQARSTGSGAALSGVVRVEGRLAGELHVDLCPISGTAGEPRSTVASGGRFRLDDVPPGQYVLFVATPKPGDPGKTKNLVEELVEVSGTEERVLEFDLANIPARFRVLSAAGEPVEGAELKLHILDRSSVVQESIPTDRDGRTTLSLPRPGRYAVLAAQEEEGLARGELEVSPGGVNELALTLSRGVECAGTAHLARGATFAAEEAELLASSEDDEWIRVRCPVRLDQGTASFHFVGLQPGKYRVLLWGGDDLLTTSFELPAQGNGALELYFDGRR
jgi:uncharacterized protein (DUF2141 family)